MSKSINIISLGCSKNLVDSEFFMYMLDASGFEVFYETEKSTDFVFINTCGFIQEAKTEAIDTIFNYVKLKKQGLVKKIYVFGCFPVRYHKELTKSIPEVDRFFGKFEYEKMLEVLGVKYQDKFSNRRIITSPKHYAYLKISEGCNRFCSFCAIPIMSGRYCSKPIEVLVDEVKILADSGVKELQVMAQDLSYYGFDLYKKHKLAELIEKISLVKGIEWIRLHYAYPSDFPLDILDVIANNPKVCKYMDIALQHCTDKMLSAMRRNITASEQLQLIETIRKRVDTINIRTTLLTGFPGETEKDFHALLQFVKAQKFERLACFSFSKEEDTYAFKNYKDSIPKKTKNSRRDLILKTQEEIVYQQSQKKLNTETKVIIDRLEDGLFVGRSEYDSPEIDGEIYIDTANLSIGEFYKVKIDKVDGYDLFGSVLK